MNNEQSFENPDEHSNQSEANQLEVSDVDRNHVRGLMYTLVTICVFCASILLGPDEHILPADGKLTIPIVNLDIKQGSFLYFGPVIIISVSIYTYLFLLKILARVKRGREYSDQYIFTMKNPAAQVSTYCIFFWLPSLVLFAFAIKALPRPESAYLLGVSLIFLIFIVALQLLIQIYQFNFLGIIAAGVFCTSLVLFGFVGDGGWLNWVRMAVNTHQEMALEQVDFKGRDLRDVEIINAKAESMILTMADLRDVVIKDSGLTEARLEHANLGKARLICADLMDANFDNANLQDATLIFTNFRGATFREANLRDATFYAAAKVACKKYGLKRTSLFEANLEKADLSRANLSKASLSFIKLNGARLFEAKMIGASVQQSSFIESDKTKSNLTKADLRCSEFVGATMNGAILRRAELGGTDLTKAKLANADLTRANFDSVYCSESCIDVYIDKPKNCTAKKVRNQQEGCSCDSNGEAKRAAKLVDTNLQFADLSKASLEGVNLTEADLRGANLSGSILSGATLIEADLRGANLSGASLSGAKLKDSDLSFAKLISIKGDPASICEQLKKAKNWKASIRDKHLECDQKSLNFESLRKISHSNDKQVRDDFRRVFEEFVRSSLKKPFEKIEGKSVFQFLDGANLSGFDLRRVNLKDIWLNNANLDRSNLTGTNLKGARFGKASLQKTIFRNADLEGAFLKDANLHKADLRGANLNGVIGLTCKQLRSAINWAESYRNPELLGCEGSNPKGAYPRIKTF